MTAVDATPTAPLRGTAVGAASAALAVAAHGMAGGALPHSSSLTLLLAACAAVGVITATVPMLTRGPLSLLAALGAGQLVAHTTMTLADHSHGASPGTAMLGAHVGATVVCAMVVLAAERLCGALTRTLDVVLTSPAPPAVTTHHPRISTGSHPGPVEALLRASISRRGPPALV